MDNKIGNVFDIQRFSVHDGPGIRTTVFLKGCPLRCTWCHNPESNTTSPQLSYNEMQCIGCGRCVDVCQNNAHTMDNNAHLFNRELCDNCFRCTEVCYRDALKKIGENMSVDEIMKIVLKDEKYYESLNGGLTVSGGEPLSQADFVYEILKAANQKNINTCVETCGYGNSDKLKKLIEVTDIFLYDIKETNNDNHVKYTGVGNEKILNNLNVLNDNGAKVILRCPIIPTYNDRLEHFRKIGELADRLSCVDEINIMPFHPYGEVKGERVGMDNSVGIEAPKEDIVKEWIYNVQQYTLTKVIRG